MNVDDNEGRLIKCNKCGKFFDRLRKTEVVESFKIDDELNYAEVVKPICPNCTEN